jgi:hypothetical protein
MSRGENRPVIRLRASVRAEERPGRGAKATMRRSGRGTVNFNFPNGSSDGSMQQKSVVYSPLGSQKWIEKAPIDIESWEFPSSLPNYFP